MAQCYIKQVSSHATATFDIDRVLADHFVCYYGFGQGQPARNSDSESTKISKETRKTSLHQMSSIDLIKITKKLCSQTVF